MRLCYICCFASDLKMKTRASNDENNHRNGFREKAESYKLAIQERTLSGEEQHKCNLCDKAFGRKASLMNHIGTHSAEKPYKCNSCDKAFAQKVHLRSHIRTHTGERPYKCNSCDKAFARKA